MNIHVSWDNEDHTVIRYDFDMKWTWDEFQTAATDAFAMTKSVNYTVDTISNFKPGAALPANALFQFRRAMAIAPKNRGVNVIVGSSTLIKTMVATFSHFNKQLGEKLVVADTLDEGRTLIRQRHPIL